MNYILNSLAVIQNAVLYREWLSKEAAEAYRTAIPGLEMNWGDEVCKLGAIEAKEEHVGLFRIGLGRRRCPRWAPLPVLSWLVTVHLCTVPRSLSDLTLTRF